MARQPKYVQYSNIEASELGKIKDVSKLRDILRTLRRAIGQRKSTFVRSGVFSHAVSTYEAETLFGVEKNKRPSISSLTRNQTIMEIVKAQKFFSAKTSTVAGARLVQREMETRLFGEGSSRTMTPEESSKFWTVYNEFIKVHPDMYYRLNSDQIQKLLAEDLLSNNNFGSEELNLYDVLESTYDYIREWEDEWNPW